MKHKIALVTGITGQDRSFQAEFSMEKGYDVYTIRCSSVDYLERIAYLEGRTYFHLHYAVLTVSMTMLQVVSKAKALGREARTELDEGIRLAYEDFLNNSMRAER